MIAYVIFGFSLLIGSLLLARWFVAAEPRQVIKVARWVLFLLAVLFGGVLVVVGRHALALLALPLLVPFLANLRSLLRRAKTAAGPSPGQTSEVTTRFFKMRLDHDSGQMSGAILEGRFRGRMIEELGLEQLIELFAETRREDPESAAVLEAYLDRVHGEAWRAATESAGGGGGEVLSREDAYQILGLEPGASADQVREAHRRLMQKIHPDHGGSNYLAAKINQAKDLLLGD